VDLLARLRAQPGGERLLAVAPAGTYLVGGAVRDLLLDRSPRELDVVTEGDASALAHALGASVEHPRFGTATVELDGARIDVATARRERYRAPGVLPEVESATLDEDLLRRDFTVNAIAVTLDGEHAGEVHAAPGALEDLRAGRLRVLHDGSFLDDPTRLLRLARYRARLGFEIDPHTAELASRAVAARALDTVSGARIGAELRLALGEPDAVGALVAMDDLSVLTALHPRLRFDQPMLTRALVLLGDHGRPDLLAMASLTLPLTIRAHDDPRAEIAALLDRLEFAAPDRDRIAAAATSVSRLADELPAAERPSQLRSAVSGTPPEGVALAGALASGAIDGEESQTQSPAWLAAHRWFEDVSDTRLLITGEDLIAAGISQGPEIGRRLDAALHMRLDGELGEGREAELAAALEASV
jgi:tRNA nucleotidyltransferase (CCA-adding enzyme)